MTLVEGAGKTAACDEILVPARGTLSSIERRNTASKRKNNKNLWFGLHRWRSLALITVGIDHSAFSVADELFESRENV
jgi:hypothetical protein